MMGEDEKGWVWGKARTFMVTVSRMLASLGSDRIELSNQEVSLKS